MISLPVVLSVLSPHNVDTSAQGEQEIQKNFRGSLKRQPTTKPLTHDERDQHGLQLHVLNFQPRRSEMMPVKSIRDSLLPCLSFFAEPGGS